MILAKRNGHPIGNISPEELASLMHEAIATAERAEMRASLQGELVDWQLQAQAHRDIMTRAATILLDKVEQLKR